MRGGPQRSCARARLLPARWLPAVIVWLAAPSVSIAGGAQPRFDSWTTENGLPQNSVNDILQTRDGYLWLATFGGLVRFDGVRFVIFDRSTPGIGSQRIRALHQDRNGTLWAATEDGMLIRYSDGGSSPTGARTGCRTPAQSESKRTTKAALWVTWVGRITKFDGQRFVEPSGRIDFAQRVAVPPAGLYATPGGPTMPRACTCSSEGRVRTILATSCNRSAEVRRVMTDSRGNVWISHHAPVSSRPSGARHPALHHARWLAERFAGRPVRRRLPATTSGFGTDASLYRIRQWQGRTVHAPRRAVSVAQFLRGPRAPRGSGRPRPGLHRRRATPSITVPCRTGRILAGGGLSILEDQAGAIWVGTRTV